MSISLETNAENVRIFGEEVLAKRLHDVRVVLCDARNFVNTGRFQILCTFHKLRQMRRRADRRKGPGDADQRDSLAGKELARVDFGRFRVLLAAGVECAEGVAGQRQF